MHNVIFLLFHSIICGYLLRTKTDVLYPIWHENDFFRKLGIQIHKLKIIMDENLHKLKNKSNFHYKNVNTKYDS